MITKQTTALRLLRHPIAMFTGLAFAICLSCAGCKIFPKQESACDECPVNVLTADNSALDSGFADSGEHSIAPELPDETLNVRPAGYPAPPPVLVQTFPDPASTEIGQLEMQHSVANAKLGSLPTPIPGVSTPVANGPNISGVHLGQTQIPASALALQLQEDNQRLTSSNASLLAANQQLRSELSKKEDLLHRSSVAMTGAELTLKEAESANQELTRRIAEVQRQQKQEQMKSERMLQSIRDELDDVLMREIALQQK